MNVTCDVSGRVGDSQRAEQWRMSRAARAPDTTINIILYNNVPRIYRIVDAEWKRRSFRENSCDWLMDLFSRRGKRLWSHIISYVTRSTEQLFNFVIKNNARMMDGRFELIKKIRCYTTVRGRIGITFQTHMAKKADYNRLTHVSKNPKLFLHTQMHIHTSWIICFSGIKPVHYYKNPHKKRFVSSKKLGELLSELFLNLIISKGWFFSDAQFQKHSFSNPAINHPYNGKPKLLG